MKKSSIGRVAWSTNEDDASIDEVLRADAGRCEFMDTDSSISILDIPSGIGICMNDGRKHSNMVMNENASGDFLWPGHYFVFCGLLVEYVDRIEDVKLKYNITHERVMKVIRCDDGTEECVFGVVNFEDDSFESSMHKMSIVINRNKCKVKCKAREDREYKTALKNGARYIRQDSMYSQQMKKLYHSQIVNGYNYIFVDESCDVADALRGIMSYLSSKKTYVPRTKSFGVTQKTMHLQNLLESISGIGRNASRCISKEYKSISGLVAFMKKDHGNRLKELRVWDEENKNFRLLGEKQSTNIRNAFIASAKTTETCSPVIQVDMDDRENESVNK
ncbi:hypothetical protein HK407_02g03600 [Ordospora pajunii]|uniref:uncharacterized protein n=1 Tax=Ordospora pajunii TaxID=3039483 RepID=UPI00295269AB|nr:uncharacterized protein HK407_02g03600 [Ordospora pajunii]KAH9411915.1 hypothetical protein HK407_02g03600 [Ordospora pajunii]